MDREKIKRIVINEIGIDPDVAKGEAIVGIFKHPDIKTIEDARIASEFISSIYKFKTVTKLVLDNISVLYFAVHSDQLQKFITIWEQTENLESLPEEQIDFMSNCLNASIFI